MKPLRIERSEGILVLTMNEPERRNTLSESMLGAMREALASAADDAGTRLVVIASSGPVFSAGHDLRELCDQPEERARRLFELCTNVMERIRLLDRPVIAEVQGLATAAGCQLALTCDLVVAAESASFATPGVRIGLFCTTPAVALARATPTKKAMEMLLTGDAVPAEEARALGMINRVVPKEALREETLALAGRILEASSRTVALGKSAFYRQIELDRPAAYAMACQAMVANSQNDDAREGMRAFLEKRTPRWPS